MVIASTMAQNPFYQKSPQTIYSQISLNTFCMRMLSENFLNDFKTLLNTLVYEITNLQLQILINVESQLSQLNQTIKHQQQTPVQKKVNINFETVKANNRLSRILNCSFAYLINDFMSILDRGFLFKQIDFYFKETNKGVTFLSNYSTNLKKLIASINANNGQVNEAQILSLISNSHKMFHSLQLDHLRIVSSYEHFLALNLPIYPELSQITLLNQTHSTHFLNDHPASLAYPLRLVIESSDYFQKHYLVGLILRQLFKSLNTFIPNIQFKSFEIFR